MTYFKGEGGMIFILGDKRVNMMELLNSKPDWEHSNSIPENTKRVYKMHINNIKNTIFVLFGILNAMKKREELKEPPIFIDHNYPLSSRWIAFQISASSDHLKDLLDGYTTRIVNED